MTKNGKIEVARRGPRATVAWEHPPANVLTTELLNELASTLRQDEVRDAHVVVVEGRDEGFCAGLDVAEHRRPTVEEMLDAFREAATALWEAPVPTLAKVDGACLGGGLELVAVCDLAVASRDATFGQPEIQLGVFPPLASATFPRSLAPKHAARLLYTGETVDAATARDLGLVGRVVDAADLDEAVDRVASTIAGMRRTALVGLKSAVRAAQPSPWEALGQAEVIYLDDVVTGPDAEEGLDAFLEDREPEWGEAA